MKKNKKIRRILGHQKKREKVQTPRLSSSRQGILQQAIALYRAGRLPEAETLYRQVLQEDANQPEALHYLGMIALQVGKSGIAAELISRSITSKPDNAEAHYNLGNALRVQGKPAEAAESYRRALALKPDYIEACYNLGILFHMLGNLREAEDSYRRVLALKPDFVGALNNFGMVLQSQDKLDEAVASYCRALALKPDFAEAHNNLGNVLHAQGKPEEAEASYRRAITYKPDYVEAHTNLGIELQAQGKLDEAAASYHRALALKPDHVDAHNNLGMILMDQGKLEEALARFRKVLALQPDYTEANSNLLLCLNYLPGQTASLYLDEARHYGKRAAGKVSAPFSGWNCSSSPERLHVGMVSGDFRNHSVGYFLENLLNTIDPTKIALSAYTINRSEDELTARLRPRFVSWQSLVGMNDAAAAHRIHEDGVHVLLDLSGHTSPNRLPVFAWKPAPVQVSWLGYSASTGLAEMDYLLADPYVAPQEEEIHFTETIWRLPESYLCFSPPHETVAVAALPALQEGTVTFGSFNNPTKMNDLVVALWAKVLGAVPGSRLLLKSKRFSEPSVCEDIRQRFSEHGVASQRLLLKSFVPTREAHLAVYNQVDIALDPFPYTGTTTSVEGLWMGVPFVTLHGDRFVSHVGESIAHNAGLADWIADDPEDYVAKAVAKAADLEALAGLRGVLRQRLLTSPLSDGPRFARNFEAAIWEMWRCFKR